MFSEDVPELEEMIGEPPVYGGTYEKVEHEETEAEKQWREWAESRGYEVIKTPTGLRINR